jgi:hypothetical protein
MAYEELLRFVEREGHALVRRDIVDDGLPLGGWVWEQCPARCPVRAFVSNSSSRHSADTPRPHKEPVGREFDLGFLSCRRTEVSKLRLDLAP